MNPQHPRYELDAFFTIPVPLWKRAFAYIIDLLAISLVILLPLEALYTSQIEENPISFFTSFVEREMTWQFFTLQLIIIFLSILYWALLEYHITQSIGKLLMGIRVESTTHELTFTQCFMRNLSKFTLALLLLDTLYMMLKHDNQRYLEFLSHTRVIHVPYNHTTTIIKKHKTP